MMVPAWPSPATLTVLMRPRPCQPPVLVVHSTMMSLAAHATQAAAWHKCNTCAVRTHGAMHATHDAMHATGSHCADVLAVFITQTQHLCYGLITNMLAQAMTNEAQPERHHQHEHCSLHALHLPLLLRVQVHALATPKKQARACRNAGQQPCYA